MIIQNLEKNGGDSKVVNINGVIRILAPQQRIKVPNDFQFDAKQFKKVDKLPSRRYNIIERGNEKIRGEFLRLVTKQI